MSSEGAGAPRSDDGGAKAPVSCWLSLHLLDRQVVDCNDRPLGKVDDLDLEVGEHEPMPVARAILCSPAALGHRLGRRIGNALDAWRSTLRDAESSPAEIPMDLMAELGPVIKLRVSEDRLSVGAVGNFLGDHVIGRIPGAGGADHATERASEDAEGSDASD
jgi:hypothetical protein